MTIIYVTKYALTKGVICVDAEQTRNNAYIYRQKGHRLPTCVYGDQYQMTEKEAVARAIMLRDNHIKSLEKRIAKLLAMKFEVKEL